MAKDGLNPKQERFCQLYATSEEFFANGVRAYAKAYGINIKKTSNYNVARTQASILLTNPNVLKRIDELIELDGFNDTYADKQLAKLIMQDADLSVKRAALRDYNQLKGRIIERLDHTSKGEKMPAPQIYLPADLPDDIVQVPEA